MRSEPELFLSNEAIEFFDSSEDYRGRPRAYKEMADCGHGDGVASNSRRSKGKGKVVDSGKKNKKLGDADGGLDTDGDADGNRY